MMTRCQRPSRTAVVATIVAALLALMLPHAPAEAAAATKTGYGTCIKAYNSVNNFPAGNEYWYASTQRRSYSYCGYDVTVGITIANRVGVDGGGDCWAFSGFVKNAQRSDNDGYVNLGFTQNVLSMYEACSYHYNEGYSYAMCFALFNCTDGS